MQKYNDFRDMSVWQKAFELLRTVYKIIKIFPTQENFTLIDDFRRADNSVLHNIAEGYGRFEAKGKTRFYKISRGSAYEVMSQVLVAQSEAYITLEKSEELISGYKEVINELSALICSL